MKTNSIKSGFGIGAIIFAVAAAVTIPLRTFHFFTVMESGTGFYSETDWSVYLYFCVIALAVLSFLVIGIVKRKKLEYSLEVTPRPGLSWICLIAACGIMLDAYNCVMKIMTPDTMSAYQDSAVKSSSLMFGLEAIFAILSGIYFILLWLTYLKGKTNGSEIRLLALAPVVWSIFRLIIRFMRTISYIRVSELLLEMLMISFLILFFMSLAQANTGIGTEKTEWKIAAYGLSAAIFSLNCFIPRLVVMLSGNSNLFYSESTLDFCDLGIALFIIATVLTRITDKLPISKTDSSEE